MLVVLVVGDCFSGRYGGGGGGGGGDGDGDGDGLYGGGILKH